MNAASAILRAGIALILFAPLISLTPRFTPPPNGCPCPEGLDVSTPFGNVGVIIGAIGIALILYSGIRLRARLFGEPPTPSREPNENAAVAVLGIAFLIIAEILSGIDLSGPGWQVYLYGDQAFYLGTLGVGMALFGGLAFVTRRASALSLAAGVVLCGISLLFSSLAYSDFLPRCSPDVGCSSVLARSIASEMLNLGYLLAAGAFLIALGLSSSWSHRRRRITGS